MVRRLGLLCVVIVILQGSACAQNQAAPDVVAQLNQTQQEMKSIKTDIAEIKADIARLIQAVEPQNPGRQNGGGPPAEPPTLEELSKDVADLKYGHSKLDKDIGDLRTALNEVTLTNETGKHYLQFDTNSQPAINELNRAIKKTVPEKGQFIIRNRTPWQQTLIVNGYEQQIGPYDERTVAVNPGTVMSWLPGEQKHTWHIGVPNFQQVVELHPRQPSYVARWVGY
jgi:prefoldin subunit 5